MKQIKYILLKAKLYETSNIYERKKNLIKIPKENAN